MFMPKCDFESLIVHPPQKLFGTFLAEPLYQRFTIRTDVSKLWKCTIPTSSCEADSLDIVDIIKMFRR